MKKEIKNTIEGYGNTGNQQALTIYNYTKNTVSASEVPTLISEFGNLFIINVLNKLDEENMEQINPDLIPYRPDEKIEYNKIISYKEDIDVIMNFNEMIKDKLNQFQGGDRATEFYRFFSNLYKKVIRIETNADKIIDFIIQETINQALQPEYVDKTRFEDIAKCFTLHAFLECKILKKPI